ncbi:MAG: PEGA domain-containing protein [Myxococcales bacterium]|nr:MAG: PEGA domain-containing protein [Myxococcales bacterium]
MPDLFGPDSFGPAPGELIDASLLDPAVVTVPPKASALPRGAVPDTPGIPSEAFKVPQAPTPADVQVAGAPKKGSRTWMLLLLFVLLLGAAGAAVWQLGLTDDLMKLAAPYLGTSQELAETTVRVAQPAPEPDEVVEAEPVVDEVVAEEATEEDVAEAAPEEAVQPTVATDGGVVKFQVVSVPSGAFVSINGKGAGRTPLEVEYEVGTKLSFFAKARGYLARRQRVTVAAGQRQVKLALSPLPWVVEVETEPAGARATAVGGGQTTTPGQLKFRSMSGTKKIVISKDGYGTVTKSVSRLNFVEEKARMAASVRATLVSDGASAPAERPPSPEPPAVAAETAEPPAAAEAEPPAVPEPVEEAPAPSEPTDADAP